MDPEFGTDCPEQMRLIEKVRFHLKRIAELSDLTAGALGMDMERVTEFDKQTELEIGEKERALGALRQHTFEHGC